MASFSFKQLTLSASRTLSHRGTAAGALSSRQFAARASIPSSSSRFIVQKRAASSQPTAADGAMIPEEVPQIVPTLEEMEKDPQLAGLGYPQFEGVSRQLRNPRAKWDDMQERTNFGEVLHEQDDVLSMWAPDVHREPASKAFAQLALMSGIMATFAGFIYLTYPEPPMKRRQYPYDGLVKELSGTDDQTYAAIPKDARGGPADEEQEEEE